MSKWFGHSEQVATNYYKRLRQADWDAASSSEESILSGGAVHAFGESSPVITDMKKPCELQGYDDHGLPEKTGLAPPVGLESIQAVWNFCLGNAA